MSVSNQQKIIFVILFVCVLHIAGCGKKDSQTTEETKQAVTESISQTPTPPEPITPLKKEELDSEIAEYFPDVLDFIYPNAAILIQEKNLTGKGVYQTKEQGGEQTDVRSASLVLNTGDDIQQALEYYRKKFPEKHFKLFNTGDQLRTVSFIHVTDIDPVTRERLEVKIKINAPHKNFTQDVVNSQLNVIQQQIKQYTGLLRIQSAQRTVAKNQDKQSVSFEKKIKELSVQAAALKNRSTLITIDIQFLAYEPNTAEPQANPID